MPTVRINPEKWASRASGAGADYASGVRAPRRSQSAAAIAAKENYKAGVTLAISEGRFEKGLQKAGDAKWLKGATEKGEQRFTQGVLGTQQEYAAGFAPFAQALTSLSLAPRGPKGTNYGRVQAVGEALRNAKKK